MPLHSYILPGVKLVEKQREKGERKSKGHTRREKAKERLWANLTGSGIPSDWSILTGFDKTRVLMSR